MEKGFVSRTLAQARQPVSDVLDARLHYAAATMPEIRPSDYFEQDGPDSAAAELASLATWRKTMQK